MSVVHSHMTTLVKVIISTFHIMTLRWHGRVSLYFNHSSDFDVTNINILTYKLTCREQQNLASKTYYKVNHRSLTKYRSISFHFLAVLTQCMSKYARTDTHDSVPLTACRESLKLFQMEIITHSYYFYLSYSFFYYNLLSRSIQFRKRFKLHTQRHILCQ